MSDMTRDTATFVGMPTPVAQNRLSATNASHATCGAATSFPSNSTGTFFRAEATDVRVLALNPKTIVANEEAEIDRPLRRLAPRSYRRTDTDDVRLQSPGAQSCFSMSTCGHVRSRVRTAPMPVLTRSRLSSTFWCRTS